MENWVIFIQQKKAAKKKPRDSSSSRLSHNQKSLHRKSDKRNKGLFYCRKETESEPNNTAVVKKVARKPKEERIAVKSVTPVSEEESKLENARLVQPTPAVQPLETQIININSDLAKILKVSSSLTKTEFIEAVQTFVQKNGLYDPTSDKILFKRWAN